MKEELENEEDKSEEKKEVSGFQKYKILVIIFSLMTIVVGFVVYYFSTHATSDDAQVLGFKIPVVSRLKAFISTLYVIENQHVQKGELLIELDSTDFVLSRNTKLAMYHQAEKNIEINIILIDKAEKELLAVKETCKKLKAVYEKAQQDFKRNEKLFLESVISSEVYTKFKTNYLVAKEDYRQGIDNINISEASLSQANKELELTKDTKKEMYAEYLLSESNLSYTKIYAPVSGTISKQNLQPGQYVQDGQNLFVIVERKNLWVTANFKETKIHKLKVGRKIQISVDAIPDHTYEGVISSIGGASIAQFALIPPSNVTGNFIKVVQRIPVRIDFIPSPMDSLLRQGTNVEVLYKIED